MPLLSPFRQTLLTSGYTPDLVKEEVLSSGRKRLVGYARQPFTARNACISIVESDEASIASTVTETSGEVGTPVICVLVSDRVEFWRASPHAEKIDEVLLADAGQMSEHVRRSIDPRSILRAKTYGRFDASYQLDLVDAGLMVSIERSQGKDLARLFERIVAELRDPREKRPDEISHQVLTIAFWILAARMLRDHDLPAFKKLDPQEGRKVLQAVQQHFGGALPLLAGAPQWEARLPAACQEAWKYGASLRRVSPEAIADVHENSLVSKQTRKDLGTHSTPPYLVDYIVGRMFGAIQDIPVERRVVFEPACGHGAFLVAALRLLADDAPTSIPRHEYLRERLRGLEIDVAAKEMARLSLTIADLPNPDGWNIVEGDLFDGGQLEDLALGASILLCNPPFGDFSKDERASLREKRGEAVLPNKAAELLRRVIPVLAPDAVMGVIVPRSFLDSASDARVRSMLLDRFQIMEICLLPDKVFQFSDAECAVILARGRKGGMPLRAPIRVRRVRETDIERFRAQALVSSEEDVPGIVALDDCDHKLSFPERRRLWSARQWGMLGEIASIGQGLSYHGWVEESGYQTVREHPFEGAVRGISSPGRQGERLLHKPPLYNYMDADPSHVRRAISGLPCHSPQVIVNYHPHSRGPWRVVAQFDDKGAALPSTCIAIRPQSGIPVEALWAFCNSPMLNAYVYAHCGKRHIFSGTLKKAPIPCLSDVAMARLTSLVKCYRSNALEGASSEELRALLHRIDALVLGGYGLFEPSEQWVLSIFEGQERPGLPFRFDRFEKTSRLPFSIFESLEGLPLCNAVGKYASPLDLNAEIDDGYRELAELRRHSGDPHVAVREQFVKETIRLLQEHYVARWIREPRASEADGARP